MSTKEVHFTGSVDGQKHFTSYRQSRGDQTELVLSWAGREIASRKSERVCFISASLVVYLYKATMASFSTLPPILQPKEEDIQMMLSAGVHTGTRNSDDSMKEYIWRRRNDGVHILNIGKTWEKLIFVIIS